MADYKRTVNVNDYEWLKHMGVRIAIVVSDFNRKITDQMLEGAYECLTYLGIEQKDITIFRVPGAFEIPPMCMRLCEKRLYEGIVTLGAVIRGETSHYDYVCGESARGIMEVNLKFRIPVSYGILTCENEEQAYNRVGGDKGHKVWDSAVCTIDMIKNYRDVG